MPCPKKLGQDPINPLQSVHPSHMTSSHVPMPNDACMAQGKRCGHALKVTCAEVRSVWTMCGPVGHVWMHMRRVRGTHAWRNRNPASGFPPNMGFPLTHNSDPRRTCQKSLSKKQTAGPFGGWTALLLRSENFVQVCYML